MMNIITYTSTTKLTAHQAEMVRQIRALQSLTKITGTHTTRTCNDILQAQTDEDLRAISLELYGN